MRSDAPFSSVLDGMLAPAASPFGHHAIATTAWIGTLDDAPNSRHAGRWVRALMPGPGERPAALSERRGIRLLALPAAIQTSIATLRAAGAALPEYCTTTDLRRAFRELARAYHPDRHPNGTRAEHQRLAAIFAEVRAAYAQVRHELATQELRIEN